MANVRTVNRQEEHDGTGGDNAERNLMLAILERATLDARGNIALVGTQDGRNSNRIRDDARAWFASRSRKYIYDFESICDVLELEPDATRCALGLP